MPETSGINNRPISQSPLKPAIKSSDKQGSLNARRVKINPEPTILGIADSEEALGEVASRGVSARDLHSRVATVADEVVLSETHQSQAQALGRGSINELTNYLTNNLAENKIPGNIQKDMETAMEFTNQVQQDTARISELVDKLDNAPLTQAEEKELNTITASNQHNLKLASSWLTAREQRMQEQGTLTPETKTLFDGLRARFANYNNAITELGTLFDHENNIPFEAVSKSDRLNAHILQAQTAVNVAKSLAQSGDPRIKKAGVALTAVLSEQHKLLVQAKALEDKAEPGAVDPKRHLKLVEKNLWEDDFSLTKIGKGKKEAIQELKKEWTRRLETHDETGRFLPLSQPGVAQGRMAMELMKFTLERIGVPKDEMPDLAFMMSEENNKSVNSQSWDPVKTTVTYSVPQDESDFREHTAQSTITPGKAFQQHFETPYESNGVNCADRLTQYQHVPNLAKTELKDEHGQVLFSGLRHGVLDPYKITAKNLKKLPQAQVRQMVTDLLPGTEHLSAEPSEQEIDSLMQGIRTDPKQASKCAKAMRTRSSEKMAEELASAAIINDPAKFESAMQGQTVDLNLSSISLLTPDNIRPAVSGAGSNEKQMLKNQTAALKRLQKLPQPVTLKVRGNDGNLHEIKANIKVRTFNFGVNRGAVATLFKKMIPVRWPLVRKLMGWSFAMKQNDPELTKLVGPMHETSGTQRSGELRNLDEETGNLGDAGRKMEQLRQEKVELQQRRKQMVETEAPDQRRAASPENLRFYDEINSIDKRLATIDKEFNEIGDAANQVKDIWRGRTYMRGGQEPYKMVSRLAFLTNKLGETTAFNCKSGKDRTGQLDSEAKFVSAVNNIDGKLPAPDSTELREARGAFTLNTGNLEMQRLTVGLPGYKLKGVPGLKNVLASDAMLPQYHGGSSYVGS